MRWIIRVIGALVVLAALLVAGSLVLPTDRIAAVAADRVALATGRSVEITGTVRPTFWPHLGVRAEGFVIGNPDWVDDGPLIAADALEIRVPWSAVFSGQVQIDEMTLLGADITLVRAADGRESWSFARATSPQAGGTPSGSDARGTAGAGGFALERASIRDARLRYRDAGSGRDFEIAGLDADLALPRDGRASVEATATVNGTALDISAEVGGLTEFLQGGVRPVTVALTWAGGQAGFAGNAAFTPVLDGEISLSATDLTPLAALAGQSAPSLPAGFGRDRIAVDGAITLATEGSAHLRDAVVVLDDTRLSVALDLLPGADRPLLRGTIAADAVSLPSAGGAAGSRGQATSGAAAGWPSDPIDASGLFAADLDLAIEARQVDLGAASLSGVDLRVTSQNGRAVVDIARIGLYGGALSGQFVANARGGLSVRSDLLLAGVELSPLLGDVAGYERLEGTGSASLQVLGVGNDIATLMRSLEGEGDLALGAGAILGLDLAGMIRTLDTSFQGAGARTVYDSLTANFTINGGVLNNDDLLLDAPWGEVTGAGQVDLGAQTLSYRMIPGVMRNDEGVTEIRVPILITGPWANPSIRPDLEFLARQELAEQAERLEAEAQRRLGEEADRLEAEARARANEALNLGLEEGDTMEDAEEALERRLREEAESQLRRLLGGN